ncbi:MAG: hypothetical protein AAFY38_12410 [Pseudomonadota bacterium]
MFRYLASAVTCAALIAPAAHARTFFQDLNLQVNAVGAGQFEVIERRGAGPRDVWCAAAKYAQQRLGQQRGRIYVAVPRGPARTVAGRSGVTFTTQAPATAVSTGVQITTRVAGASLPVNHAIQFCRDRIIEPEDRF